MARPLFDVLQNQSTPPAGHYADLEKKNDQMGALVNEHATALDALGASPGASVAETITTGAALLLAKTTWLSTTGAQAYTLADGTFDGQIKIFEEITAGAGAAGTLTVAHMDTPGGGVAATFVFNTKAQRLVLVWSVALTAWHITELVTAGQYPVTIGTTVLTGIVMNSSLNLTLPTGANHSTATKAIPNGRKPGQRLHVAAGTATGSPVCDIAITATTKTGMAAATSLANLVDKTWSLTGEWDGGSWQAIEFTAGADTATLS